MYRIKISLFLVLPVVWICTGLRVQAQRNHTDTVLHIDSSIRVPLPDGVHLSGILAYRGDKPVPAVLRVNCYPVLNDNDRQRITMMADSGYAGVIIYTRGKAGSEGAFYPFENDAADNYAVIDWISKQPWCNGKVGMYGGSYLGFTQWAAVKNCHPALKTIVPQVAVGPGIDYPNPGGAFLTYSLQWLKYVRNGSYSDRQQRVDNGKWDGLKRRYLQEGISFDRFDSLEGRGNKDTVFQRWLAHPAWDSFWQRMTPTPTEFAALKIPVLTTTGFFDDDQRGAMYYYGMHHKYASPAATKEHYLLIGPYDHAGGQGGILKPSIGPYLTDAAARISQKNILFQWFDYTLRGGRRPVFLTDKVNVFVIGENAWHHFPSVGKMNRDTLVYYLVGDSANALASVKRKTGPALQLSFSTGYLPEDTLAVFTNNNALITDRLFLRRDLLVMSTPPLVRSCILNGSITANLYLSASAPDADILFSWWEIDSLGKRWPLASTVQRLSHSQDRSKRQPWLPGRIYPVKLDNIHWMSKQLSKGSRVVMTISNAANAYWQRNYGSVTDVSRQTAADKRRVVLKIYASGAQASSIHVPVL